MRGRRQHRDTTTPEARDLLAWYDRHARALPWRIGPAERRAGIVPDPYRVWLAEIMLQQTRVATAEGYYRRFLARWPDVAALAAAPVEAILAQWAGLGYYARARNLARCANEIVTEHGGAFPRSEDALRALPGIGEYTAAAISAIAFDQPAIVVDGNVKRVVARLKAIDASARQLHGEARAAVGAMVPPARPGDFAQAMMDLGATVCTPANPDCANCPLQGRCAAFRARTAENYPRKAEKAERQKRRGAAFAAIRDGREILLRRRGANGLLAGMNGLPSSDWSASQDGATGAMAAPFSGRWRKAGAIRHVFTHFELELDVWRAEFPASFASTGDAADRWTSIGEIATAGLPTLMAKAAALALGPGSKPERKSRR
jgi:A/G-specific adenine glycosylase